jgi:cyclic pyranopterin phosphate synthase
VRLTTEGHLLLCLGQKETIDLRQIVRTYPNDMTLLKQTIIKALPIKPSRHHFYDEKHLPTLHAMNRIGG